MSKILLVLAPIIASVLFWFWRYRSKDAEARKLKKRRKAIKRELKQLREEIRLAKPEDEDGLIARYHNLDMERLQIDHDLRS